ncbi:putative ubiquitin conjugating enzyme E2 [Aspergillus stella-maris]|uniref:putative ubiquitin conjugating enzyme E2 n=1 Tax=Aspergillus stella-maris TaxID=1810926 RepID=UPI003CCD69EE
MVSKLRRLAADHAALHEDLPPNYLFPADDTSSDDITQLLVLLAGPQGTPYSQGLWRLHLKLPEDYPKSPPKATFKTRIWHPNVEESSGAVCVDTLKRDWKSSLTLRDVLVTISCLLIYPNPDSALNSTAGALLQENYDAFARQAKLMTSIHASVPVDMRNQATEAKMRGEDIGTTIPEDQPEDQEKEKEKEKESSRTLRSRQGQRVQAVTMKKKPSQSSTTPQPQSHLHPSENTQPRPSHDPVSDDETENENPATASKENDPSLSPSPVKFAAPSTLTLSPRKNAHGKRPLSVLTTSASAMDIDPFYPSASGDGNGLMDDVMEMEIEDDDMMTASERNIAANIQPLPHPHSHPRARSTRSTPARDITMPDRHWDRERGRDGSPQRKSPKLSLLNRGSTPRHQTQPQAQYQLREESSSTEVAIYEDAPSRPGSGSGSSEDSLEDYHEAPVLQQRKPRALASIPLSKAQPASLPLPLPKSKSQPGSGSGNGMGNRKVSSGSGLKKGKARVGIRRL